VKVTVMAVSVTQEEIVTPPSPALAGDTHSLRVGNFYCYAEGGRESERGGGTGLILI
jgi:hypothetical protein